MASEGSPRIPLLEVRGLSKSFGASGLLRRSAPVVAARDVAFRLDRGEAVALVGESGSGKSTVARMILRLEQADGGQILLDGVDVLERERRSASLAYRGRIQMVFQDPFGSLNPVHDVFHHLARPLLRHRVGSLNPVHDVFHHLARPVIRHHRAPDSTVHERAIELLRTVGLEPAEEFIRRHPYELSGGQRQRVAIARALAAEPDVLVADEPTSMLDVSIRMGILALLAQLKRERGLAILLITHDLTSARALCDRILVFHRGRVVEAGSAADIVDAPIHPYTRMLIGAIAKYGDDSPARQSPAVERRAASMVGGEAGGSGCPFAPRCAEAFDLCGQSDPQPRPAMGREVRCHLYPTEAIGIEDQGVGAAPAGRDRSSAEDLRRSP